MQTGNTAGTVTLRSKDPRQPPHIDFKYFEEQGERDLKALSEAADYVLEVMDSVSAPCTPMTVVLPLPGLPRSQAIKEQAFSHHATSTCHMGPNDHPDYCVDNDFKVNGVQDLRVVDASVFPRTPGAFPVTPTFMISQKAFRVIMAGLKNRTTS